jgi:hypothetical protein
MFKDQTVAFGRLEGGAVLAASLYVYHLIGANWWIYLLLWLVVDASAAGYLINNRAGALIYNLGHSLVLPLIVLLTAYALNNLSIQALALIWLGHIGVDRLLGYGLKQTSGFTHTHLGTIGRK